VDSALKTREYNRLRRFESIDEICKFTSDIDIALLEPVRDLNLDKEKTNKTFDSIVRHNIGENVNMTSDEFHTELKLSEINFFNMEELQTDIYITIDKNFEMISYKIPDEGELTLKNPDLLWDCSCSFTGGDECRIHSKQLGQEVNDRFGDGFAKISFRDVEVVWTDCPYFWPPSVDTIYMIENLLENGIHKDFNRSLLEIGCGSALMSILLADKSESIRQVYANDWLLTPLLFSRINWELNKKELSNTAFYPILGHGDHWVGDTNPEEVNIDQAVCNPPYLPDLGKYDSVRESTTVGGTYLLELLIEDGYKFADDIYINYSNIAEPEVEEALSNSKASMEIVGGPETVPFRVSSALGNPQYMASLIDERDLIVRDDSRYPYWHNIKTCHLTFE